MPDFNDFAPLYDFSLVEKAVQAFFVALPGGSYVAPANDDDPDREKWSAGPGNIAFYTAFQALTFTQCRPRVWIDDFAFSKLPGWDVVDFNGTLRPRAWSGRIRFGLITLPNFTLHTALRAQVSAILPLLQPSVTGDLADVGNTGVNALLQYHEVGQFTMQDCTPAITPQLGYYSSPITVNLTFSVRAPAWPGGTITT